MLQTDISSQYRLEVQKVGDEIQLQVTKGAEFVPQVVADFRGRIKSIQVKEPSLDDVFLKLTGRAIREEEATAKDLMRQGMKVWRR